MRGKKGMLSINAQVSIDIFNCLYHHCHVMARADLSSVQLPQGEDCLWSRLQA